MEGRLSALPSRAASSGTRREARGARGRRRGCASPNVPVGQGRARGRTRCEVWPCSPPLGRVSRGAMLKRGAAVLCLSLLQLFQTSPRGGAFTSFHLFTSRMKVLEIRSSLWIFGSLHRSDGIPRRSRPDWGPRGWGSAPRGERPLSAKERGAGGRADQRAARGQPSRREGAKNGAPPPHRVSANENAAPERGRASRRGCCVRSRRGGARRGRNAGECGRQRASTWANRQRRSAAPRASRRASRRRRRERRLARAGAGEKRRRLAASFCYAPRGRKRPCAYPKGWTHSALRTERFGRVTAKSGRIPEACGRIF